MSRTPPALQAIPLIQFADHTLLNISVRGWEIMLTPDEGVAILEWLQAHEGELRGKLAQPEALSV